ncbi:MAG: hypothetical protein J5897_03225 [Candidatus Methanomethylophilus sp.]|nr:hypothetical protein [Methanomethylophilus sp.]MBO5600036.1 hypothetical protein [Methanomethylophilus sp.]
MIFFDIRSPLENSPATLIEKAILALFLLKLPDTPEAEREQCHNGSVAAFKVVFVPESLN